MLILFNMVGIIGKVSLEHILNDTDYRFSDHYIYHSLLGKGGFGYVVEAVSKTTMENMAVKVTNKTFNI